MNLKQVTERVQATARNTGRKEKLALPDLKETLLFFERVIK